jgi:hypothetical protein
VAWLIFIDIRRYRRWTGGIVYSLFAIIILLLIYGTIEARVNTIAVDVQYKEYTGLNGTFTYKLPEKWRVQRQEFGKDEIIYHSDFTSEDRKINGYVQVWNLNKPLIDFIKEGQKSPIGIVSFKFYTVEPVKIDGREGYILQYSRKQDGNKYIRAFEVFIMDKNNTFHRLAFYMDEQVWKDENRSFFLNIAASSKLE